MRGEVLREGAEGLGEGGRAGGLWRGLKGRGEVLIEGSGEG